MKNHVMKGRYTVDNSEDIVVFLIGMRINKWWAIHKWLPVLLAMPPMIIELYTHKEKLGFLSEESFFGLRKTVSIQYWKTTDELIAYAANEKHMTAWKAFNQKMRNNDAVAVYHETYSVHNGNYECIYVNMPHYGLGKALTTQPVTKLQNSARMRLNGNRT